MLSGNEIVERQLERMFEEILEHVSVDRVREILKRKDRTIEDYREQFGLYPWESPVPELDRCYSYRIPLSCWESQYPTELMDPQSYNPYTGTVRVYVSVCDDEVNDGLIDIEWACDTYLDKIFEKLAAGETVTDLTIPDSVWKKNFDPGMIEHEVSICEEM